MKTGFIAIFLLSLLWTAPTTLAGDAKEPIDQTITREIDLTGDGVPEVVLVHLKAMDLDSPFRWTLTITSKGKNIYTVERDDTWLNEFFRDDDFTSDSGCIGYAECKRKYYFDDLLQIVVRPISGPGEHPLYAKVEAGDDMGGAGVWHTGKEYLVSTLHLDKSKAEKIIAALLIRLKAKRLPIISTNISPIMVDSPMIYVEEIDSFMPVYRE